MKLTSKSRYAVTALLTVAIYAKEKPISLSDISEMQSISLSYLEQLFSKLRRAGLVSSVRGPGGGYQLNKGVDDITIAMIIAAVDESFDATLCKGSKSCRGGERCLTHALWADFSQRMGDFLRQITIGELMRNRTSIGKPLTQSHDELYTVNL